MARELTMNLWCDVCLAAGDREQAEGEYTITVVGVLQSRPRLVALCERHRKEHYDPIVTLLQDFSSVPDAAPKATKKAAAAAAASGGREKSAEDPSRGTTAGVLRGGGGEICPKCGHELTGLPGMQRHAVEDHGRTLAQLQGVPTPFACEETGEDDEGPWIENGKCQMAFRFAQHLALHMSRTHGTQYKSKAS